LQNDFLTALSNIGLTMKLKVMISMPDIKAKSIVLFIQ